MFYWLAPTIGLVFILSVAEVVFGRPLWLPLRGFWSTFYVLSVGISAAEPSFGALSVGLSAAEPPTVAPTVATTGLFGAFYIAFTISSGNSICISINFAPLILEYPSFSLYVNLISLPVTNASIFRLAIRICFDL